MGISISGHAGLSMEVLRRPFSPVETSLLHFVSALGCGQPMVIQWRWIENAAGKTDTGVRLSGQRLLRDGVLNRELLNTRGTRGGRHIPQTLSVCLNTSFWKNREPLQPGMQDMVSEFQLITSTGPHYETACPRCTHQQSLMLWPERQSASCAQCGYSADADALEEDLRSQRVVFAGVEKSEARVRG
jgi:hypothetical protein